MRVYTIIPAYNEAANIENVLFELERDFSESTIVVVNDASSDDTESIVRAHGVICISHVFNMGYAAALQTGFKYVLQQGCDYVVQFDGDGQHIAAEARKLYLKAIESKADVVIGSRFLVLSGYHNSFFRQIGTNLFKLLIRLLCGRKITDPTSGLQVLRSNVIEMLSKMNEFPEFPDANLLIELLDKGFRIQEEAVVMRLRSSGTSMHGGLVKPIKYMILMIYSILIILIGRKRSQM